MADLSTVSPGAVAGAFVLGLFGTLAFVTQLLKFINHRKTQATWQGIGPTELAPGRIPPPPAHAAPPPAHAAPPPVVEPRPLAAQLEGKDVEVLHLRQQLYEAQEGCRRLRRQLDEAAGERVRRERAEEAARTLRRLLDETASDQARMAASLALERSAAEAMKAEADELRRQLGQEAHLDARSRERPGDAARGGLRRDAGGRPALRETDRPVPRQPR